MERGIGGYYISRYGLTDGARRMAEDGYTALDFNLSETDGKYYTLSEEGLLAAINEIKEALDSNGIGISQAHGPWRFPPKDGTEEDRAERFEKMTRSARIAASLGAKYLIIHPLMPFGVDENVNGDKVYEINKKFYSRLADEVKKFGITICLENMPFREFPLSSTDSLISLIEDMGKENVGFCFDTGHANYYGEPIPASLRRAEKHLAVLHVHDNFADHDAHLPPYEGNIDWGKFIEGLYEIGYCGVMNFETNPTKLEGFDTMTEEEIRNAEISLARYARLFSE